MTEPNVSDKCQNTDNLVVEPCEGLQPATLEQTKRDITETITEVSDEDIRSVGNWNKVKLTAVGDGDEITIEPYTTFGARK